MLLIFNYICKAFSEFFKSLSHFGYRVIQKQPQRHQNTKLPQRIFKYLIYSIFNLELTLNQIR